MTTSQSFFAGTHTRARRSHRGSGDWADDGRGTGGSLRSGWRPRGAADRE